MTALQLPLLIAHRGAPLVAPENTLSSLIRAHAMGATWVEFDVMLTKDHVAIVMHDEQLDRTTNGHGRVTRATSADIAALDAGSWFAAEYQHEKIPTLELWLKTAASLKMGINLEMKVRHQRSAKILARQIAEGLDKYWNDSLPAPLISSFYTPCLQAIFTTAPHLARGFLIRYWTHNFQRILDRYECVTLHMSHRYLRPERAEYIKTLGRKLLVYTIDDLDRARQLFAMGVDSIFSNNPELLKV